MGSDLATGRVVPGAVENGQETCADARVGAGVRFGSTAGSQARTGETTESNDRTKKSEAVAQFAVRTPVSGNHAFREGSASVALRCAKDPGQDAGSSRYY